MENYASDLTDDGDRVTMEDGRELRLRVVPDEYTSIMDEQGEGVWCGRLAWPHHNRETGRDERPSDMDGGARLIRYGRGHDAIWWQVPADLLRGEGDLAAVESAIRDLLEYGYSQVGVELWETVTDSRGTEHQVKVADAWVGGCYAVDEELVADLVAEVLAEVGADV